MMTLLSPRQRDIRPASLVVGLAASIAAVFGTASGAQAQERVYLRSIVGQPWNDSTNEASLNTVFGSGGWSDLRYESVDTTSLFSNATRFIFMEGGDFTADEMEAFLDANRPALETWVSEGGSLLVNAAPFEGDGMNLGFGVSLTYPVFSDNVSAVNGLHPIFNGPFGTTGTSFSGFSFGHAVTSGSGVSAILTDDNTGGVVLGEKAFGGGHVVFGGMTVTSFHDPQPNATTLRKNLLSYADSKGSQIPEPGTLALFLASAAPLCLVARRRKC